MDERQWRRRVMERQKGSEGGVLSTFEGVD